MKHLSRFLLLLCAVVSLRGMKQNNLEFSHFEFYKVLKSLPKGVLEIIFEQACTSGSISYPKDLINKVLKNSSFPTRLSEKSFVKTKKKQVLFFNCHKTINQKTASVGVQVEHELDEKGWGKKKTILNYYPCQEHPFFMEIQQTASIIYSTPSKCEIPEDKFTVFKNTLFDFVRISPTCQSAVIQHEKGIQVLENMLLSSFFLESRSSELLHLSWKSGNLQSMLLGSDNAHCFGLDKKGNLLIAGIKHSLFRAPSIEHLGSISITLYPERVEIGERLGGMQIIRCVPYPHFDTPTKKNKTALKLYAWPLLLYKDTLSSTQLRFILAALAGIKYRKKWSVSKKRGCLFKLFCSDSSNPFTDKEKEDLTKMPPRCLEYLKGVGAL